MLTIAICDDSSEFRRIFQNAIKKLTKDIFPKSLQNIVFVDFNQSKKVIDYLETDTIDILFLDIDMPEMNGLELAKQLVWRNADTVIVFVSGYDKFVYEVFEFSPFAFLRKDRIFDELPKTLARIAEKLERKSTDVEIVTVDGTCTVCARDMLYIKSKGNYYYCCDKTGKQLTCRGTLSEAESLFCKYDFFRVHSAYLVNLYHIRRIDKSDLYIGLNNEKIPIAQRRLADFRKVYAEFTMRNFQL